ncbi:MAG: TIM barrel protein [Eubacteriales bacterium]|nr:TIM barrel protein [Eubacteriales bacterium]
MDQEWSRYMKLGVVFAVAYPESGNTEEEYLKCLKKVLCDTELESVEITHIENPDMRKKVYGMLKQANVMVAYCAQPVILGKKLNLNALDELERKNAVEAVKTCVDEAYELGAESLSLASGRNEAGVSEKAMDALVDSMIQICDYAREKGELFIEMEMFDYNLDVCRFIGPSLRAAKLAERVREKCTNFWILPDLSHIPQQWETVSECLKNVHCYVRRAHIGNCVVKKDAPARGDKHPRFGFPNSAVGINEIKEYIELLMQYGIFNERNRPALSIEIRPMPGEDPDCILAGSKRMIKQALR